MKNATRRTSTTLVIPRIFGLRPSAADQKYVSLANEWKRVLRLIFHIEYSFNFISIEKYVDYNFEHTCSFVRFREVNILI